MDKKKKKIIIGSIVAVILIAVVIAMILFVMTRLKVVDNFTIEYGNEISNQVTDYVLDETDEKVVKNATVEIVGLDENAEYPAVGDYVVKVKYKNQVREVIVTVEDTTKPVFKDFNKEINIYTGEQVDWNTLFVADDLSEVTISVDDSAVNYSAEGTYQITVTATDTSNNIVSEVGNVKIIQTSLAISAGSVKLQKGNAYQLQSKVVGRDQNVKYTSSDTSVATVDNGKITGVGKGTATITVEANGVTLDCEVTVTVASKTTKKTSSNNSNNNTPPSDSDEDGTGQTRGSNNVPEGWKDESDDFDPNDVIHDPDDEWNWITP